MPRDGRTLPHNILEEMRFRAIEAYQAGKGVAEIAKLLGVHWGSVSRWLTKWRRDGQRALKERKATGRPPKLDCKRHGKAILKLVKHPATEFGYEHPLWTCQRIRQVISVELNLAVSVPTLWRELKKLKLSCQKPERRALEQDPKARARWIATEWPRIKRLAKGAARFSLLRRRVGGSINSNSRQNLGAGGKDSDSSRYGQESQCTSHERSEPARSIVL